MCVFVVHALGSFVRYFASGLVTDTETTSTPSSDWKHHILDGRMLLLECLTWCVESLLLHAVFYWMKCVVLFADWLPVTSCVWSSVSADLTARELCELISHYASSYMGEILQQLTLVDWYHSSTYKFLPCRAAKTSLDITSPAILYAATSFVCQRLSYGLTAV